MTRALVLLALAGLLAGSLAGCGKHKFGQYDLDSALHKYCIEVRWGRILKAAQHVAPEMRAAFVESWATRSGRINIQELEVVSMAVAGNGDEAAVMLRVTYVDNASMRIQSRMLNQSWKRTEYGWFAYDIFDLDGEAKPAPTVPTEPAPADPAPTDGDRGFGG